MTTQPAQPLTPGRMTADEFLDWAQGQPGRFELVDGRVTPMASERSAHALTKGAAFLALTRALRALGVEGQVYPDGMAVRVASETVYEPDALVRLGPPLPDDALEVGDPLVVVEVLSPSTQGVDTSEKLTGYLALPSLSHYLVLNPTSRAILHYRRGADEGRPELRILHAPPSADGRGPELLLDPPGLLLHCADLFAAP